MMPPLSIDLAAGPDLHPLYPSPQSLLLLFNGSPRLSHEQRRVLVAHSLSRAVAFGDIALLSFLLREPWARDVVDLVSKDEDGIGLVSQAILGFGEESDRDVEREEVIRLLISEGADVLSCDVVGWTPLHFAALHAPPTLIAHLLTHGASPLSRSRGGLTPLDVITGHEPLPGRDHIALLLEEAMREHGYYGSERELRKEQLKRRQEMRSQARQLRLDEWRQIGAILQFPEEWWGEDDQEHDILYDDDWSQSEDEDEDEEEPAIFTPFHDHDSVLVFSLSNLPQLLDSLISDAHPIVQPLSKRCAPANGLYYLTRFACLWCDSTWVEELVVGAVDKIEEVIHSRPDDLSFLAFWLFNATLFLHLLRCDNHVNQICESLELFNLLEELMNAVFVFIIRVVEKRIDPLIDPALLEHSPLASEFDSIQFEDEWSFFRSFTTPRRKAGPYSKSATPSGSPQPPSIPNFVPDARSTSPSPDKSAVKAFSTLRFLASGPPSSSPSNRDIPSTPPSYKQNTSNSIDPSSIAVILTAVHTVLSLYGINPTLIIQANSQILYWTACELFNRLISRKRYICRSRAMQIGVNVSVVEEWVTQIGLPRAVGSHFTCVRQLLGWLQCMSSINDFPALIDTIQAMKALNPLQMRRVVKDYRYEVSEGRMTDECLQYLAQLQKDWERQRIKLGVEMARKEREREREDDIHSNASDEVGHNDSTSGSEDSKSRHMDEAQRLLDNLFDPAHVKSEWEPPKPPEPLGELMNSRFMLPLLLPSDPLLLCASGGSETLHPPQAFTAGMDSSTTFKPTPNLPSGIQPNAASLTVLRKDNGHSRSSSRASHRSHASVRSVRSISRGPMRWRDQGGKVREVDVGLLDLVGGVTRTAWDAFGVRFLDIDAKVESRDIVGDWHEDQVEEDGVTPVNGAPIIEKVAENDNKGETTPSDPRVVNGLARESEAISNADARSVSEASITSYLTPNLPRTTAEKRRSMRLARRSSGGETAMPISEYRGLATEDTPVVERSPAAFT